MKNGTFKKLLVLVVLLGALAFAGYWSLTAPAMWAALHPTRDVADASSVDLTRGHTLFFAGACGTCHATPAKGTAAWDETRLGGGLALASDFGTFYMPNISSDAADGIGGWTTQEFIRAMREGTSKQGANEYPAFPYTSFQRMTANDLRDLFGYMKTLPAVSGKVRDHDLKFPFTMRRGVGLWKLVFLDGEKLPDAPGRSAGWLRGRALVEGAGHCAECHSPRDAAGAVVADKRFAGAPDPEGNGWVPNISQDETGIGYWSTREIADYLGQGVSPVGLRAGGSMAAIVANLAKLSPEDRTSMAEYLKTLPAIAAQAPGAPPPNRTDRVQMIAAGAGTAALRPAALAAPAEKVAQSKILYAVATKPFFLVQPSSGIEAAGAGDGRVLPAGKLTVVAAQGDWLHVKIGGWRQQGSDAALYALQGQRILVAALSPKAAAGVVQGKTMKDAGTGMTWTEGSVDGWISKTDLNPDLQAVWAYSSALYNGSCGACHALQPPSGFLANQWIGNLNAMKRFTALDDGQYRLLQAYLQFHAKDAVATAPAGKL